MALIDQQMHEYFHLFMDSREEPHFLSSLQGELLAANPAACEMMGRSEEELQQFNIASLVDSPEAFARSLRNWARTTSPLPEPLTWLGRTDRFSTFGHGSMIEHQPSARQYLIIHATTAVTTSPQFIDSGKTLQELHSTEQKLIAASKLLRQEMAGHRQTKAILKGLHSRLTAILDTIEAVVYAADMQTHEILFINDYGRNLIGEIQGRTCWQVLQGRQRPCSFCSTLRPPSPDGLPGKPQSRAVQDQVTGRWHQLTIQAVPWADDRIVRLGVLTELIEQKDAGHPPEDEDGELDSSWWLNRLEFWNLTFDAIDEVVTIHDREMRIIRANKATGKLLGVDPADLIGRHCYEVVRGASRPCPGCPELLAGADLQPHEATISHEDLGKSFLVSSSPLLDKHSMLQGFIHMAKDVTRQRALESKLQHTQKMEAIGVLAGGIAHDFNNILAPIVGYTDLALNRISPAGSVVSYLQQINSAAKRARELVQQILTFGRQAPQEKKPLLLHLVVNEALKLLRSILPADIMIKQNVPDCGAVMADPIQIHQIVMNLATNGAHAMKEKGGVLGVKLSRLEADQARQAGLELPPGPYLVLEVSDNGHGMSPEVLARIFEPYFTTKGTGEGSGLGLAVVHGIVESYGGQVTAESRPGKGTTFRVCLPHLPGNLPKDESILHRPLPGGSERLLVVDDEEVIVPMLREMLEGLGYSVTVSNDSLDTWRLFLRHRFAFDLILTDMAMPGLTGLELAKRILTLRPGMPIILCTGHSELLDAERSRAAGIRAFLVKPVTMRELAETVRRVLDGNS